MIELGSNIVATKKLIEVGPVDLWLSERLTGGREPKMKGFYLRGVDISAGKTHGVRLTQEEAFTLGTALVAWSERVQKEMAAAP